MKNPLKLIIAIVFICWNAITVSAEISLTTTPAPFRAALGGQSATQNLQATRSCTWDIVGGGGTFIMLNNNGVQSELSIIFRPGTLQTGEITATLTINDDGDNRSYTLTGTIDNTLPLNKPVDVIMVVDVSGSMADGAACDAAPSGGSKMNYLKEKMKALYRAMHGAFRTNTSHRFGMVSFSSSANTLIPTTSFSMLSPNSVNNSIDALSASGATSMGAGLQQAVTNLGGITNPDPGRARVIILLTNGMQNTSPMVERSGGSIRIGSPANITISGSDLIVLPYGIFTPNGEYLDLLNRLAINIPTAWNFGTDPRICNATDDLQSAWIASASVTGSPKTVSFISGKMNGNTGAETFVVTENMDMLTFYVSSVGAHNYASLKVEKKNGATYQDITGLGTVSPALSSSSQHRVWSIVFPQASLPLSSGEYRLSFTSNQSNLYYDASAILDDRGLKQAFHAMPIVAAGETMYLGAQLLQANTPVSDSRVKAIIYGPKRALNTAFARKNVPAAFIQTSGPFSRKIAMDGGVRYDGYAKNISITHPSLPSFREEGDRMQIGEKKYLVLMEETNFEQVFEQEVLATVPLVHIGQGIYHGEFKGIKKTGLHRVRFEAEGEHPNIGPYKRFEERTPIVRFGTPDVKRSCLFEMYDRPSTIMMKPIDIVGNLLGPYQNEAFSIEVNGTKYGSEPKDYLDGRYVLRTWGIQPNDFVTISIHDRLFYRGAFKGIPRKPWFFSIHAGGALPLSGDLEDAFGAGPFGELRLGYRFRSPWGVQVKGAYHRFFKSAPGADYNLVNLNAGAVYRIWFASYTGFYLQGEASVGAYNQSNGDWQLGYNAGLGIQKPLGHFVNLTLDANVHQFGAQNPNSFVNLGLGLQFRFGPCRPMRSINDVP
jgi:hypothetical protein